MTAGNLLERIAVGAAVGAVAFLQTVGGGLSPQAAGAIIAGIFSIAVALLALWQQRRSQRLAAEAKEADLKREIEDRTRAAEEGMKVRLANITESTMTQLRETINVLSSERDKLAKATMEMQTQMFASAAEASRLTRENISLVAQHASDVELLTNCRSNRTALETELSVVRAMLAEAQATIKNGIIAVERERHEAKNPPSKDRPAVSGK